MSIGLDIGISSTKVVAFVAKKLNKAEIWESGFSEKLLQEFISSLSSIDSKVEKIAVTGVGSKKISGIFISGSTLDHWYSGVFDSTTITFQDVPNTLSEISVIFPKFLV